MSLRWKLFFLTFVSQFFPMLAFADNPSTSFAPPASDQSVVFLGNLFGMVDGVLHGTGSQMMGTLLGAFNAGVLALGGIVIVYIIIVSTMNTAHEGQMLGQKWSSIWVPVRATIGLALLIPKSSGYCLMQVFVMWVVLQGVGVADKIWNSALDYMNRGGVIITENLNPNLSIGVGETNEIMTGAATVLYGQVCMEGIQTQLESVRTSYLNSKESGTGECAGNPSTAMKSFCEESVPDLIGSVSPLTYYSTNSAQTTFTLPMPNIDTSSVYSGLNGVCGTIQWNAVSSTDINSISSVDGISQSDIETIEASRAAAIDQVYTSLATTAKMIVNNDPGINSNGVSTDDASTIASSQFGVPLLSDGTSVCTSLNDNCPYWGADPNFQTSAAVLLQGTELQDAVADYNAVMSPTINMINEASDSDSASAARDFISKAERNGWIMAGKYFFDLVTLNGSAKSNATIDSNTGFNNSTFSVSDMTGAFGDTACQGTYEVLCTFITMNNKAMITKVASLIDGSGATLPDGTGGLMSSVPKTDYSSATFSNISGLGSSTVYGYTNNAALIDLATQTGSSTSVTITSSLPTLKVATLDPPDMGSECKGHVKIWGKKICYAPTSPLSDASKYFFNTLMPYVMFQAENLAQDLFVIVAVYPLVGFGAVFQGGIDLLNQDGINPIVGLAQMGVAYIDFAMDTWIAMIAASVLGSFLPTTFAVLTATLPFFFAWEGVMLGIGFLTAYFVPFLPYMIFTFGVLAWLMSVIEAMVAAPIVALGVAHPEGHDALGKSEQGLMILLNVFLRPGMMIIGYISAIALSYVGVWVMNTGFQHIFQYLETSAVWGMKDTLSYTGITWAENFGSFFGALVYVMMYLTIVTKAFSLIAVLPDKVLRWIGGQPEGVGQETMQWSEEAKSKVGEGGKATSGAGGAMQKQVAGAVAEKLGGGKPAEAGPSDVESSGDDEGGSGGGASTPPPEEIPPPV